MKVNVFVLIQRDQGDRLGELKMFVTGLQHLFSAEEIVKVSIGVGNSSVLAVREIHAFF